MVMQIEEVRIEDIENHPTNPKIHPDKQIRLIQESIKKFGWTNPVILSADNTILAGHARVKAAIAAGNDTVPCIRTKLGRCCRAVELSPDYCAVILQRFKDATGKEPVRINE